MSTPARLPRRGPRLSPLWSLATCRDDSVRRSFDKQLRVKPRKTKAVTGHRTPNWEEKYQANMNVTSANRKALYDCDKCIAYCCSIYDRVQVTPSDVRRLAAHFRVTPEIATQRYTKLFGKERILRRKADRLFGQACMFLNQETRKCTIYNARPETCREFPTTSRCAYYDLIEFEREQQGDLDVMPLVKITFENGTGKS